MTVFTYRHESVVWGVVLWGVLSNDEPASVLLERIRGERNGRKNGKVERKAVEHVVLEEPVNLDVEGMQQAGVIGRGQAPPVPVGRVDCQNVGATLAVALVAVALVAVAQMMVAPDATYHPCRLGSQYIVQPVWGCRILFISSRILCVAHTRKKYRLTKRATASKRRTISKGRLSQLIPMGLG